MDINKLKTSFVNSMILGGFDKTVVNNIADDAVRAGCEAFWRAKNWTFARKYAIVTLTANSSAAVNAPSDADKILAITRLTTDDDGFNVRIITEEEFNRLFPYPAEMDIDEIYYAKVIRDAGTLKIQFAQKSNDTLTFGVVYKMKFDLIQFAAIVPDDYEPFVKVCTMYHALPAGTQERMTMYQEYLSELRRAKQYDGTTQNSAGSLVGDDNVLPEKRYGWPIAFWLSSLLLLLGLAFPAYAQDYSTRSEMLSQVRYQERAVNDTFVVNDFTLIRILNQAVQETDQRLRGYQRFDTIWTTAGTAAYALNTDCYDNGVVGVKLLADSSLGQYVALKNINTRDVGQQTAGTESGYPTWYYTYGGKIILEPTPAETKRVEIEYEARAGKYSTVDSLTSDSLTSIKPEHEQLVIDYTRYLLKKRLGLDQEAAAILADWKTNLAEARALLQRRPDPLVSPQGERGK